MERPRHPVLLYSLILLMVLGWSFNFIVGKITLEHINPYALASFRIVLSGIFMLPVYFAMPRRSRLNRKDLWTFAVLGFWGVAVNRVLFILGLNLTTAAHSALIVASAPILILMLARAHRLESVTVSKVAGMVMCCAGILVLVAGGGTRTHHHGSWMGDLITLGGTIGFAIYTVLAKKVARQYDTISMNTFCNLAGAIFLFPLALYQAFRLDWGSVGVTGWLGLAYMVAISSIGAYLIFFWALAHVSASRLAAFTYIESPLATLLGVVFLGEKLTSGLLIGGCLILIGVYLTEFGPSGQHTPETAGA